MIKSLERPEVSHWAIDRRVPLALILAIFMQGMVGIWWASDITTRIITVEAHENAHAVKIDALIKLQEERYERIVRLEEKLTSQSLTLERIEKKIDSKIQN